MKSPRRLGAVALGVAAVFALGACGGPAAPAETPAPAAGSGDSAAVRTIETPYGPVEIEGVPERVVTSGNYESDIALQLGVVPVAQGQWLDLADGTPDWRRPLLEGAEPPPFIAYNADGYDVEETLGYDPDLVLNSFLQQSEFEALNAAVPTISLGYELDSHEFTRRIAAALGKEAEAEALLAETDASVAEVAAANPAFAGATVSVAYAAPDGTLLNYTDPTTLNLLTQLGFVPAPGAAAIPPFDYIGPEQFAVFDADLMIVGYGTPEEQTQFESQPLFQQIPAVAAGNYLGTADPDLFELVRSFSPAQIEYALDNLVPQLATYVN